MDYTTQMDAARKGIFTKELAAVAEKEGIAQEELRELVAEGKRLYQRIKFIHVWIQTG